MVNQRKKFATWEARHVSARNQVLAKRIDEDHARLETRGRVDRTNDYRTEFADKLSALEKSIDLQTLKSDPFWEDFSIMIGAYASQRLASILSKYEPDIVPLSRVEKLTISRADATKTYRFHENYIQR